MSCAGHVQGQHVLARFCSGSLKHLGCSMSFGNVASSATVVACCPFQQWFPSDSCSCQRTFAGGALSASCKRRFLKDIQPDMLELNDRLLVTSPRTAARRGAIAAARRGQEQVRAKLLDVLFCALVRNPLVGTSARCKEGALWSMLSGNTSSDV